MRRSIQVEMQAENFEATFKHFRGVILENKRKMFALISELLSI